MFTVIYNRKKKHYSSELTYEIKNTRLHLRTIKKTRLFIRTQIKKMKNTCLLLCIIKEKNIC